MIRFQLLSCQVEIKVQDPLVLDALRYMAVDAAQAYTPCLTVSYEVSGSMEDGYIICVDGRYLTSAQDPQQIMAAIYTHCHEAAHQALPPYMRVHAGLATIAGLRVAFIGRKLAGKTALMLRMVCDDVTVHGDEWMLVLEDGKTIAFPRRFHVRPHSFTVIPELQPIKADLPFTFTQDGSRMYGFSPTDLGKKWSIKAAPLDIVIFIKANHGKDTALEALDFPEIVRRLRGNMTFPERSVEWASTLMQVAARAKGFALLNGSLTDSVEVIRQLCASRALAE